MNLWISRGIGDHAYSERTMQSENLVPDAGIAMCLLPHQQIQQRSGREFYLHSVSEGRQLLGGSLQFSRSNALFWSTLSITANYLMHVVIQVARLCCKIHSFRVIGNSDALIDRRLTSPAKSRNKLDSHFSWKPCLM